ncbi:hypothetical protein H8M03_02065 [Sphingomonas sabuli]|uniref:Secreted protein n=1 Tax=Sphingomonas sabuli TaxID=2764186 RepID=A0A7G9L3G8_9SPHN|nr:hypothetical protein [Sphingomonas sabuli]QNM83167.1 hypothetical protein H8M03_02065 [Sphingomonas sabuli]
MKHASLAIAAIASLALAGCGGRDEDQLDESEINAPQAADLNQLSDEAAGVASEAAALEEQAAQLENQVNATTETEAGPETPADENIEGM